MDTICLTNREIKRLKPYTLNEGIYNNESYLYYYNNQELLKLFKSHINKINSS